MTNSSIALLFLVAPWLIGSEEAEWIRTLRRVGPEGTGNVEAGKAWRQLAGQGSAEVLPRLLEAMDESNPLADNWMRSAFEAISGRIVEKGGAHEKDGAFPAAQIESFLLDRSRSPRARRLAYEWLRRVDAKAEERLIPKMLDDPSVELRRDAVARLISQAGELEKAGKSEELKEVLKRTLAAARDFDQTDYSLKKLRGLGEKVDVPALFGFLREWMVIGPFDNQKNCGFESIYGPEKEFRLDGAQEGKTGPIRWKIHSCADEFGEVDLNQAVVLEKGVAAYAVTEFYIDQDRDIELRAATVNGWKLWVNGEPLFSRNEYHHGTQLDHYQVKARFRAGKNLILLKVCQNEQTEDYAKTWGFQIRVCDSAGTAILSTQRPSFAAAGAKPEKASGTAEKGGR